MDDQKINLLLVDDEEEFLEFIAKRLEARDFNVITVTRGEAAVETARTRHIDIALVDLKMPGMDGNQTLAALKAEHQWMEIVILTGHGSVDSAVEATRAGAYHYLQKPCDMDNLISVLTEAYKKRLINKKAIEEKKLDDLLMASRALSPRELLAKLKKLDTIES